MAKKKGGGRPPKNLNLIGQGKKETRKEIIDRGNAEKGLTHVQRLEKRRAENSKSQINQKNRIEEAKKQQPKKEPAKAKQPQKSKQNEVKKDR